MSSLSREQLLVVLCPAFLLFVGYQYIYLRGAQQEHRNATKAVADAQAKAPEILHQLQHLQQEEAAAQKELASLQAQQASLQSQWQTMQARTLETDTQTVVEQLGGLMRRHGLYVQAAVDDPAASPPAAWTEIHRQLAKPRPPALWKFQVIGSYRDILEVLGALSRGEAGMVVPVAITMEKANLDVSLRRWTLEVAW